MWLRELHWMWILLTCVPHSTFRESSRREAPTLRKPKLYEMREKWDGRQSRKLLRRVEKFLDSVPFANAIRNGFSVSVCTWVLRFYSISVDRVSLCKRRIRLDKYFHCRWCRLRSRVRCPFSRWRQRPGSLRSSFMQREDSSIAFANPLSSRLYSYNFICFELYFFPSSRDLWVKLYIFFFSLIQFQQCESAWRSYSINWSKIRARRCGISRLIRIQWLQFISRNAPLWGCYHRFHRNHNPIFIAKLAQRVHLRNYGAR